MTAARSGNFALVVGDAATEVSFYRPVEQTVRSRVSYILSHQTTPERAGWLAYGIVPVDTRYGLTQTTNGWPDWSDGSERIGMAILIQQAVGRGWAPDRAVDLLAGWAEMVRHHLLDETFAPRRAGRLDAGSSLGRAFSESAVSVANQLLRIGSHARAKHLQAQLVESATFFWEVGTQLPNHEVNYEQSIARRSLTSSSMPNPSATIPGSFGGPQPNTRQNGVAIRHWDGFWFGTERLWGDIFPHHWSALTSTALLRLPGRLSTARLREIGMRVLRSNMSNYFDDGSATCAFVMPSVVDGRPAHIADPVANDQDWHLSLWLRLADEHGVPLG